jgi:hypothetical protein
VRVKGTIYHHSQLVFHNGFVGKKYLVLLNTPNNNEPFLFVKTTSQKKDKPSTLGCIRSRSLFFIPAGTTFFKLDTWVQLYEIYPITDSNVTRNRDISCVGSLDAELLDKIIDCLFLAQEYDILPLHKALIRPTIDDSLRKLKDKFGKRYN